MLREPGIRIGRTDPKLDPKGALTVQLLNKAEQVYHQPGLAKAVLGEAENPDATVTQTYDIMVAIDKLELNPQAAFMQGKIKITGNLMKLMQLQGFSSQVGPAIAGLEREY